MKRILSLVILFSMPILLLAETNNLTLQDRLFQGSDKGFLWDKPIARGEVRTVFYRYNDFLDEKILSLKAETELKLRDILAQIGELPKPKDYNADITALQNRIDDLSEKLIDARAEIGRIQRREKIDYTGTPLESKIVQEWSAPWYASAELLNAAGQSQQVLEAGYRFRFFDPDYTASVIPVARYSNGTLFMGARAEAHW